ncbi:glycosyltransferase family 2 protein [uncultured Cyclobacterium sp.]|uniref:glycosyltransferase family 2 protein n=1 Tax=uncultured Cyclobacterium sp. TaxID=453820 RepID=UPI0030EEF754|tara:strand:- start:6961 stop:7977 length:1017 start_codon:yes stop_codon:yes gene_type:complete
MISFSIITPVFNTSTWLEACINSVIDQTYFNWELILVDDGSTDGSWMICESLKEIDARIKPIRQKNQGVVAARFNGFQTSSGNVILFLDSDDKLRPYALQGIEKEMRSGNFDLLRFGFDYCDMNWNSKQTLLPPLSGSLERRSLMLENHGPLKQYSSPSIWDKAYTRELASKVFALTKDKRIKHSEDMLFSLTALVLSHNTFFLKKACYLYLQRPGSAIHSLNINSINDKESYIEGLVHLLDILPNEYHKRLKKLINEESNEAITYVLNNGSCYAKGYYDLTKIIINLKKSTLYRKYVLMVNRKPKYLLRDILLHIPPFFAILLISRVKFNKIINYFR